MAFRAIRMNRTDAGVTDALVTLDDADLDTGDVTVKVDYSTINYKDGMAIANAAPVIQRYPITPGIDLAGTVTASDHAGFAPGDRVVLNGWGLSQTHDGGFAELARVPGDWLVPLPDAIGTRHAAAIGTAGYTAMLAVMALEHAGVTPDAGDVLVTGANGGVGSVAIALLARLGFRVIASTGRPAEAAYLKALGAAEIVDRATLSSAGKPIAAERWASAIDSVGSHTLANVLAQTRYGGAVSACGLAQGADLPATVLPFIIRGVTLCGIDSVNAPHARRVAAWNRLATDLDLARLDTMVMTVSLAEAPAVARSIFAGQIRGRTLVDVNA